LVLVHVLQRCNEDEVRSEEFASGATRNQLGLATPLIFGVRLLDLEFICLAAVFFAMKTALARWLCISFGHSSQSTDLRVFLSPSAVVVVIYLFVHRTPSLFNRTTRLSTTVLGP